jgi:hypothetical protein
MLYLRFWFTINSYFLSEHIRCLMTSPNTNAPFICWRMDNVQTNYSFQGFSILNLRLYIGIQKKFFLNRVKSGRQKVILCLTDNVFKYCIEVLNKFSIDDNGGSETAMKTTTNENSKPKYSVQPPAIILFSCTYRHVWFPRELGLQ